jgi:hypothetical protein
MIRDPGAGPWTVTAAPGSSAITTVSYARGYPKPKITVRVTGHGQAQRLSYTLSARKGLAVTFAERAHRTYHLIGRVTQAHGTLRFTPAPGPAGRRQIDAIITDDGVQRETISAASYQAPGPPTPGLVRSLTIHRHGARFQIRFGQAPGAATYRLRVTATDGRRLLKLIGHSGHTLTLPVVGYADHVTVTVTAVSSTGRAGRATNARA